MAQRWELEDPYSVRNLESQLGVSKTEIGASLNRSVASELAIRSRANGRPRPHRRNLNEFIAHGLKFVFPAWPGPIERGMPTAFAAPALQDRLISGGDNIYVWLSADSDKQGQSIQPLFRTVPEAARRDEGLYAYLALTDAIRLGNPQEAGLAKEDLSARLLNR